MIQSSQLRTRKGSLTNARTVTTDAYEALFSYATLVGVKTAAQVYIQRDRLAASNTTGRHIGEWLREYGLTAKDAVTVTNEAVLQIIIAHTEC